MNKLHNTFVNSLRNYVFCMPSLTKHFSGRMDDFLPLELWYFHMFLVYYILVHISITNNYNGDNRGDFPIQTILEVRESRFKGIKFLPTVSEPNNQLNIGRYSQAIHTIFIHSFISLLIIK